MNKICQMTFDNVLKRVVKGDDAEADNDEDRVSITTAAGSA